MNYSSYNIHSPHPDSTVSVVNGEGFILYDHAIGRKGDVWMGVRRRAHMSNIVTDGAYSRAQCYQA
jgi:hypothetical protein